jgi:hypothetical protein
MLTTEPFFTTLLEGRRFQAVLGIPPTSPSGSPKEVGQ